MPSFLEQVSPKTSIFQYTIITLKKYSFALKVPIESLCL